MEGYHHKGFIGGLLEVYYEKKRDRKREKDTQTERERERKMRSD